MCIYALNVYPVVTGRAYGIGYWTTATAPVFLNQSVLISMNEDTGNKIRSC